MFLLSLFSSVLELLHPAPHGHLHHLQTRPVNLLDQAEDRGENVGILETKKLYRVSPRHDFKFSLRIVEIGVLTVGYHIVVKTRASQQEIPTSHISFSISIPVFTTCYSAYHRGNTHR